MRAMKSTGQAISRMPLRVSERGPLRSAASQPMSAAEAPPATSAMSSQLSPPCIYLPSTCRMARNASCGISTEPTCFMRFLPAFCFSSSFFLRVMSPP